jgi:hypothetical protein
MRIGVLGCFYDCADTLPRALAPWIALKQAGMPLLLGGIHAQFKEYAQLGYANDDAPTLALLNAYRKDFAVLDIAQEPLEEREVRTRLMRQLTEKGVDAIWMLDGDEIYTQEEILRTLTYIQATPQFDYYHVHLDQYIGGAVHWRDPFFPPRIIRTDRYGGIREFSFDNEVVFADGRTLETVVPGIVPRHVAHVRHETWRGNMQKKIDYHHKRFGLCAMKIEQGKLAFDSRYFERWGIPTPTLTHDVARAPLIPLLVAYRGPHEERSLNTLWAALLVCERRNEYEIDWVIEEGAQPWDYARQVAALSPFATKVVSQAGPTHTTVSESACRGGTPYLVKLLQSTL